MTESRPFTEERLRRFIRDERDPAWPSPEASDNDVAALHARVIAALHSSATTVEEDLDDHGSGYASYKEVWIRSALEPFDRAPDGRVMKLAVRVRMSKLAPLAESQAAWSWAREHDAIADARSRARWVRAAQPTGWTYSLAALPDAPDWEAVARHVAMSLAAHGFSIVPEDQFAIPLWFDAKIATLSSDPPYTVGDAIFHWID